MRETTVQDTRTEIETIRNTLDPTEREHLINDFHAARQHTYQSWTYRFIKTWGIDYRFHDDVFQEVQLQAHQRLLEWTPNVTNWEGHTAKYIRTRIRDEFDTGRWNPTQRTGTITLQRRKRRLRAVATDLQHTLGRTPTNDEIVTVHNAKLANNPNATKQGLVATVLDLGSQFPHEHNDTTNPNYDHPGNILTECVLATTEGPVVARSVVNTAHSISSTAGAVADVWLGDYPTVNSSPPYIANQTGIAETTVRRTVKQIREEAIHVLAVQYNITGQDWHTE